MRNRNTKLVIPHKGYKFRIKWKGKYVAGLKHLKQLNHSGRFILKNGIVFELEFMQWIKHDMEFTEHPESGAVPPPLRHKQDIIIDTFDDSGQLIQSYRMTSCHISEYEALPEMNAGGSAVGIHSVTLECEDWERDDA